MMPMMQQPGYPMHSMQGGPPPGYPQQQPAQWQPPSSYQNQPAMQTGRIYTGNDRLPAMPDMMRRPAATSQPPENRQPLVRGGPPESISPPSASSPGWTPIRIPTPAEMGIAQASAKPTPSNSINLPDRYDIGTITNWLDRQGAKSCQREKLAEGVQYVCSFNTNTPSIAVRGVTDEDALQKLVQEVVRRKQELTLNRP